jgi:hypothetical protein
LVEVESPDGWVKVNKFIKKGKKLAYKLEIDNKEILSSENHLYETNDGWILAKDLDNKKHKILCKNNRFENFKITKTDKMINVVDISVDNKNHRYYTNGISSHNTNLGKSLIMTSLGVDCALRNKNVLYVTCEMSEEKISERIMTNLFDVNTEDLKLLTKDKFHEKFEKLKARFNNKIESSKKKRMGEISP